VIPHKIAKNSKPLLEGQFVKEFLVDSALLICAKKRNIGAGPTTSANRDEKGLRTL